MKKTKEQIKSDLDLIQSSSFVQKLSYRGSKHGELALALNYILIYAKEYSRFVDLFAGSGCASANVVINKEKHTFVLNELRASMSNLFQMIINSRSACTIKATIISNLNDIQSQVKSVGQALKDVKKLLQGYSDILKDFDDHPYKVVDLPYMASLVLLLYHPKIRDFSRNLSRKRIDDFCEENMSNYVDDIFRFYSYIFSVKSLNGVSEHTINYLCNKKKSVIYADPPYICSTTTDYFSFSKKTAKRLISNLCNSKQQFIYSCYARTYTQGGGLNTVKNRSKYFSIDDGQYEPINYIERDEDGYFILYDTLKKVSDGNMLVYENILHEFERLQTELQKTYYVVCICISNDTNMVSVEDMLQDDNVRFEIMITNIKPSMTENIFYKSSNDSEEYNAGLSVLKLSEFNKLVREYVYLDGRHAEELFNSIK